MSESITLDLDLSTLRAKQSLDRFGSTAKTSGQKSGLKFVSGFSSKLKGLGAAFAGFFAIRKVADDLTSFNTSLAEIKTITQGLSINQRELTSQLIETSKQFGTDASSQAKSFYQIISAGITDAGEANKLLIASNQLAIGGLTSTDQSIDLLTSAVNSFGRENLTAARAADIIFATVRVGKTRVDELASSLGIILPSAKSLGISFVEVNAALAQLTSKGVSTSLAVTRLNAVFTAVLKKQTAAKSILGDNAKLFSLQALRTKGLTSFLKDLNVALGGSQIKLQALLGRTEAAQAIISLAQDNFKGMADKVDSLTNSTGAADEAFKIMNDTIGQQLRVSLSILVNGIIGASSTLGLALVSALKSVNETMRVFFDNIGSITRKILIFIAILKVGSIFTVFKAGLLSLRTGFLFLTADLKVFLLNMRLGAATGVGFFTRLKISMKATRIGMTLLRVAAKLLKLAFSIGLLLVIDALIEKFIIFNEKTKSISDTFKAIGLSIKVNFLGALESMFTFLASRAPKFFGFFGITKDLVKSVRQEMALANGEILKLTTNTANIKPKLNIQKTASTETVDPLATLRAQVAAAQEDILSRFANAKQVLGEGIFGSLELKSKEELDTILSKLTNFKDQSLSSLKTMAKASEEASKIMKNSFVNGISNGIGAMVRAVRSGENAFAAFAKALIGTLGEMAIQMGKVFLTSGIGMLALEELKPAQAIAAGLGLILVGNIIKSSIGGGSVPTAVSSEALPPSSESAQPPGIDSQIKPTTQVAINVEGTVLDPVSVGEQISAVLQQAFDAKGTTVVTA